MAFFDYFPLRWFTIGGEQVLLTNITRKVSIKDSVRRNSALMVPYVIRDHERPDELSQRLYDSKDYWWVVMMVNEFESLNDWPMNDSDVLGYTQKKYIGVSTNVQTDTKHMEDPEGNIFDPAGLVHLHNDLNSIEEAIQIYDLSPVTYYEYELRKNDERREIQMVAPEYIETFENDLKRVLDNVK